MPAEADEWSSWLRERRDAGNDRQRAVALDHLSEIRERILQAAEPLRGSTVLDVGTGDGLVGLAALDRVGPEGVVIFSDISEALLAQCRLEVEARGNLDRAQFIRASAEGIAEIPDASVDVVTTRSVLIYVADKTRAFSAFHRVLRSGGCLSLFEPINRLMFPEPSDRFWGYDIGSVVDLAERVKAQFTALEDPAFREAMMDFDDRDLARFAETAGFEHVHVECHIDIEPGSLMRSVDLGTLLDSAPNPNGPTIRAALTAALTKSERQRFLAALQRAFVEARAIRRTVAAYLTATKT
jgi:arsenite methyltransferase